MMNVLLITNKNDVTTDFIVRELTHKGCAFYRLNTEEIGLSLQISYNVSENEYLIFDTVNNITIDLLKIKAVYFRRPEIYTTFTGITDAEANFIRSELLFVLEGLYKILKNAFWLNTVDAIRNAENKVFQMMLASEIGFSVPSTIVTNQPKAALDFYNINNQDCIIKPVKSGLVEAGVEEGVIFTEKVELNNLNVGRIKGCPVYLQSLIHKKADIRITIVGNQLFPAMIHSQDQPASKIDWRRSGIILEHSEIELPEQIKEKCLTLTEKLSLNFGAVDMILDTDDRYIFLEINPNGQWAWIEKHLNYPIAETITNLLIEKAA